MAPLVDAPQNDVDPPDMVERPTRESAAKARLDEADEGMAPPQDFDSSPGHRSSTHLRTAADAGRPINITSPHFPSNVPHTRAEVLAEASFLFGRILVAHGRAPPDTDPDAEPLDPRAFAAATLTPRLLGAFLSVHYAHANTRACAELWDRLWRMSGVAPSARVVVEALERCANAPKREREDAQAWADKLWETWAPAERAWRARNLVVDSELAGMSARLVERAHVARVHLFTM
jgi:hypothetical protein